MRERATVEKQKVYTQIVIDVTDADRAVELAQRAV